MFNLVFNEYKKQKNKFYSEKKNRFQRLGTTDKIFVLITFFLLIAVIALNYFVFQCDAEIIVVWSYHAAVVLSLLFVFVFSNRMTCFLDKEEKIEIREYYDVFIKGFSETLADINKEYSKIQQEKFVSWVITECDIRINEKEKLHERLTGLYFCILLIPALLNATGIDSNTKVVLVGVIGILVMLAPPILTTREKRKVNYERMKSDLNYILIRMSE